MIKGITRPAIFYDMVGLANNGVINIGRESDSTIRLDCPEVPFLLSRKHAIVRVNPDGSIGLRDLNSTNGTYVGREGEFLHRMRVEEVWELKKGDIIGFGGPETIVARSEQPDVIVANPFLFKYVPIDELDSELPSASGRQALEEVRPGHFGIHAQPRRLSFATQEEDVGQDEAMEEAQEEAQEEGDGVSSAGADKENKHGTKRKLTTGKDVAALLSNHLMCAICQEWLAASHTLSCGHMFCGVCLANWLQQKHSCPECRKPIVGMPVRCRNVDNTIADLLGNNLTSPTSRRERKRKTNAWDQVGDSVAEEWANALNQRRTAATQNAARHLAVLTGVPVPAGGAPAGAPAPAGAANPIAVAAAAAGAAVQAAVVAAAGAHRQSEHGAAPGGRRGALGASNGRYAAQPAQR